MSREDSEWNANLATAESGLFPSPCGPKPARSISRAQS